MLPFPHAWVSSVGRWTTIIRLCASLFPASKKEKLTSINKQLALLIYHAFCADKAKQEMKKPNASEMEDGGDTGGKLCRDSRSGLAVFLSSGSRPGFIPPPSLTLHCTVICIHVSCAARHAQSSDMEGTDRFRAVQVSLIGLTATLISKKQNLYDHITY